MTTSRLSLLPILMIVLVAAKAEPAVSGVAGQWRVEFATPLGQRAVNMTIEQAGTKITGHVIDEYGEYELKGRFANGRVTAAWSVPENGRMLVITMRGRLEGNVISGTAQLGSVGEGALSARRTG